MSIRVLRNALDGFINDVKKIDCFCHPNKTKIGRAARLTWSSKLTLRLMVYYYHFETMFFTLNITRTMAFRMRTNQCVFANVIQ